MSPNERHDGDTYLKGGIYHEDFFDDIRISVVIYLVITVQDLHGLLSETMVPFMVKVRACKATLMPCQRKARTSLT